MKVFICWSGDRGLKFASACGNWITAVVGSQLQPALSVDIEKGGLWFDDLTQALTEARAGILCLTPEGTSSPWIHFEAGILAKTLEAGGGRQDSPPLRIFPFLFRVEGGSLRGPLAAFQATSATDRDDGWRLIESLLAVIPDADRPKRKDVSERFKTQWTIFQTALEDIPPAPLNAVLPDLESMFRRKTFDESMYDCLTQGWLQRYDASRDVQTRLHALAPTVRKACRRFVADVFDALIVELNAYSMCLSVLIGRPVFPISEDGTVAFEHRGIAEGCERHRKRIKTLVARLADDRQAPVFDEAFQFETAETFAERKRLIHRRTADLRENPDRTRQMLTSMPAPQAEYRSNAERCRSSDWDFDRIMYNVWLAEDSGVPVSVEIAATTAKTELERAASMTPTPSLMALHYALRPLQKAVAADPLAAPVEVSGALSDINEFIKARDADGGGQIRRLLTEIEALVHRPPAVTVG